MSGWEITMLCLVAVIAFSLFLLALFGVIKAIAIVKLARAIQRKLNKVVDPLLHAASRVGRRVEDETEFLDECEGKFGHRRGSDWVSVIVDIAKWATIGATIFSKFRKRR